MIADCLRANTVIRGAVPRLGESNGFCDGADLVELTPLWSSLRGVVTQDDLRRVVEVACGFSRQLRKLEMCGKPVAVALDGSALGGGLEIALACHIRVGVDNPKLRLDLPEATIGLMRGGGGTQRLPRI